MTPIDPTRPIGRVPRLRASRGMGDMSLMGGQAPTSAPDAGSAEVLENIKGLLA